MHTSPQISIKPTLINGMLKKASHWRIVFKLKSPGVKVLKFEPSKPYFPKIKTMRSSVPEWYRKGVRQLEPSGNIKAPQPTIKSCVPFLDAMTSGYYIPLPVDIYVTQENGLPYYAWQPSDEEHINIRTPDAVQGLPIPPGYANQYAGWKTAVALELPKGYSAVFTHPLNRTDLPFFTLSGIVDSYTMYNGVIPFFLQKDFVGLIPQGTPIVQIIPFKRESWSAEESLGLYAKSQLTHGEMSHVFSGWYRNNVWQKKNYK